MPSIDTWIHSNQRPPYRDQASVLATFRKNPRIFSVADRVAEGVASAEWRAYRVTGPDVLRDFRSMDEYARRDAKKDLIEVGNSQTLALWNRATPDMTAHQIRRTMQLHLDLAGETYSLLELNGLGMPGFIYPLNPVWVTPPDGRAFSGERMYTINGGGFSNKMFPADRIFGIRKVDPNDPYGRGVGIGTALANEIDIDEYGAQTAAAKFFNGGMPDWFIKLEGMGETELKVYKAKFQEQFRGHRKSGQVNFTNAKGLEAVKLDQSFVDLDLVELRKFAAEVIRESFGVPPEITGNVENSNRATISAAYYLFATLCLVPRLRTIEDAINQRLVPLLGEEGIMITYDSPVPEDEESEREVKLALPRAFRVNEIRDAGGEDPIEDGGDELYSEIDVSVTDPMTQDQIDAQDQAQLDEADAAQPADQAPAQPADQPKANDAAPAASQLSLNGGQVTAAKEVVLDVAYGRLPRETGLAMLESFFGLTSEQAESIMGAVGKTFKPTPEGGVADPAAADANP